MKHNPITLITGALLVVIFAFMLFTFQVRETEVAVWTTFGKPSGSLTNAGFYWRAPWPVQTIYRFDKRTQNFERKFEQTTTQDAKTIIMSVFVGWRIAQPQLFLERFGTGDQVKMGQAFEGLVSDAKNSVISAHPFSDLISTNRQDLKFDQIETEMRDLIRPAALSKYGIQVEMLGIKQLALPESITSKVFDRMRAERTRLVKKYQSEGDAKALEIRSEANRKRQEILNAAEATATIIQGQGDAEASKSLTAFEKNPGLAVFLLQLRALEASVTNRTTIIMDQNTPPFNMLSQQAAEAVGRTNK